MNKTPKNRLQAGDLIQAERLRPPPDASVGEAIWHGVQSTVSYDVEEGPMELLPARRTWRSPWKVGRKAVGILAALYSPVALSFLIGAVLLASGGYWAGRHEAAIGRTQSGSQPAPVKATPTEPAMRVPAGVPAASVSATPVIAIPTLPPLTSATHKRRATFPSAAPVQTSATNGVLESELREGQLLEEARASLSRGQSAEALKSLAQAQTISRADLAEERDALTVMALARSGDATGARRQMAAFAQRHPDSLYLSKLRSEIVSTNAD